MKHYLLIIIIINIMRIIYTEYLILIQWILCINAHILLMFSVQASEPWILYYGQNNTRSSKQLIIEVF